MGWKIVRDNNEAWCRAHGVSGQWRVSPDPLPALLRKLYEEAGEYAEAWDVAELYDLADVLERARVLATTSSEDYELGSMVCSWSATPFGDAITAVTLYAQSRWAPHLHAAEIALGREIARVDPDGTGRKAHAAKLEEMGGFGDLIEWCPVPAGEDGQ
jgi:predicted house-cleaning noncanonical NTP pyrophosphatase (MazG superfamily)